METADQGGSMLISKEIWTHPPEPFSFLRTAMVSRIRHQCSATGPPWRSDEETLIAGGDERIGPVEPSGSSKDPSSQDPPSAKAFVHRREVFLKIVVISREVVIPRNLSIWQITLVYK